MPIYRQQVCHRMRETQIPHRIFTLYGPTISFKVDKTRTALWTPGLGQGGINSYSASQTRRLINNDEKCYTDFRVSHATAKVFELCRVLTDKSVKMKT